MDQIAATPGAAGAPPTRPPAGRAGIAGGLTILLGTMLSLLGMSWDVQWHDDVGPDTFFTMPHLFLYAGSGVAGITSLVMVLRTTAAVRAGREVDGTAGGTPIGVFGRTFSAPVGYLVTGTAAATFLISGLWDQLWHTTYGFDATIASPPHVALLLSITFTMVGVMTTFAAARSTTWGRVGFQLAVSMLIFFVLVPLKALELLDGAVNAVHAGIAFCTALALVTAAYFLRARREIAVIGLISVALQAGLWWFSPWASEAYAHSVGLPMREFLSPAPDVPSLLPMCLLPLTLGLAVATSRGGPPTRIAPIAGGIIGLAIAVTMPVQLTIAAEEPWQAAGTTAATALLGSALGALAGFLGLRFAAMLRSLTTAPAGGQ